jgi:hypothetical protein
MCAHTSFVFKKTITKDGISKSQCKDMKNLSNSQIKTPKKSILGV